MDRREKSVIRGNHKELADDLILDEDFYSALRQNKLFSDGMIAKIKEVSKPRDQVYQMLELLEKRGPEAFRKFIKVLESDHYWLADKLQSDYEERLRDPTKKDIDYTAYSYERTPNILRPRNMVSTTQSPRTMNTYSNSDIPTPKAVCPENTVQKKRANLSHSNSLNQIYCAEDQYSNRESQRAKGSCYAQEVGNTDETDSRNGKNFNERKFADACVSPIQIVQPKASAQIEAKVPALNLTNLQSNGTSDDENDFPDEYGLDNMSEGSSQVFVDNENTCEDMTDGFKSIVLIQDDNDDDDEVHEATDDDDIENSDNEEVQTARDSFETQYDSMQGFKINETVITEEPNSAEEDHIDKFAEQDYSVPDIDKEYHQKIRILAKLQSLLMANQENPEQDLDQSNESYEERVSLDMIEDVVDSLQMNTTSQESEAKCLEYIDKKDRKKPLHICFRIQKDELIETKEKLLEEMNKVNDMANDMYNHQNEMKNLEKLKDTLKTAKCENTILQNKVSDMETSSLELNKRIKDLETSLKTKQESVDEDKPPLATVAKRTRRLTRDKELSPRKSFNPDSPRLAMFNTSNYQPGMYSNPKGRTSGLSSSFNSPRTTTATGRTANGKKYNPK